MELAGAAGRGEMLEGVKGRGKNLEKERGGKKREKLDGKESGRVCLTYYYCALTYV